MVRSNVTEYLSAKLKMYSEQKQEEQLKFHKMESNK